MKRKSCLTNLMGIYNGVTSWVDERMVNVFYLDFNKPFGMVSHNVTIDKLTMYGLDKWQ